MLQQVKEGLEVGASLDCIYLMLIGLPCLGEGIHILFLERFCWWRIHLQRVDRRSVLPYTEVKVRTSRATCRTHISNDLTLTDTLAYLKAFCIS